MLDFFNTTPPPAKPKEKKLRGYHTRITELTASKNEILDISTNLRAKMKLTLPSNTFQKPEVIKSTPERDANQRTRRGDSTSLF